MFNGSSMCIGLWTGDFSRMSSKTKQLFNLRTHKSKYHKIPSDQSVAAPLQLHGQPYPALSSLLPGAYRLSSSHNSTPHWLSEDNSHRLSMWKCLFGMPSALWLLQGQTLSYLVGSPRAAFFISAPISHSPFQDSVGLSLPSGLIVPGGSQWESIAPVSRLLVCLLH